MNSYVLIVDDQEDILDIHELSVKCTYRGDVKRAASGKSALEVIKEFGIPKVIISDYHMPEGDGLFLLRSLVEASINIPFILCSATLSEIKSTFSHVHLIPKPNIVGPIIRLLELLLPEERLPDYVPLKMTQLLRMGPIDFDLFLRLSDKNFVKAFKRGEVFTSLDAEKYNLKGIDELYVCGEHTAKLISDVEYYLANLAPQIMPSKKNIELSYETVTSVERLARTLGWSDDTISLAKKSVDLVIKSISQEEKLFDLVCLKFSDSRYEQHVGKLALMTTAFCLKTEWNTEATQMKLGLAALLHDMTVDPCVYGELESWNSRAANLADQSEETVRYRNHPIDAVKVLYRMKSVPPDVDTIIMNHHHGFEECSFPSSIIPSRITHLTAIFILMEDLLHDLERNGHTADAVGAFLRSREEKYSRGRFKKVFEILKTSMLEAV